MEKTSIAFASKKYRKILQGVYAIYVTRKNSRKNNKKKEEKCSVWVKTRDFSLELRQLGLECYA